MLLVTWALAFSSFIVLAAWPSWTVAVSSIAFGVALGLSGLSPIPFRKKG
jgi:hypothetical protein